MMTAYTIAHATHGETGFVGGFLHPLLGPDHLLAMMAVGFLSSMIGGAAVWRVPVLFLVSMLAGAVLSIRSLVALPAEYGIAVSVILLGVAIFIDRKFPFFLAATGCAAFGLFHGYAHGVEMPGSSDPFVYALGFLVGTTLVHLAGVGAGHLSVKLKWRRSLFRGAGAALVLAGIYFLVRLFRG